MATASETQTAIRPPTATAMTLAQVPEETLQRRYGTTRAEVEAVKSALAPAGTTDYEMLLYLGLCKRMGLDPFVPGLVHFARFPKTDEAGNIIGKRTGIILGYLGYLQLAQQQQDCDGFEVTSFPAEFDKPLTHATATVWKKGWSHPLTASVLFKEKNQERSKFWRESPRQALETAAIRRVVRMAWPSLFAAVEDSDAPDPDGLPKVNGRVGTVLGEHHDIVDGESRPVPPDAPPPAALPPPPPPPTGPTQADVDKVVDAIVEMLEDPAVNYQKRGSLWSLVNSRLELRKLGALRDAKPGDLTFVETLRDDVRRVHGGT